MQIEKDGAVQFAAYDNFDPESLFWGAALQGEFQKSLAEHEILESARPRAQIEPACHVDWDRPVIYNPGHAQSGPWPRHQPRRVHRAP